MANGLYRGTGTNTVDLIAGANGITGQVIDNLTSTSTIDALSAHMGNDLNTNKVNKNGDTMLGALNMNNFDITNVNSVIFNDPGVNEGILFLGGNLWKIYESPNDLSNAAGNLQFIQGSTRRFTIGTDGTISINGVSLLNLTYPVGAIYQSNVSTSPATLFGGTWVALTDRFLVGAGSTYTNGSTGGASTVTLSVDQIPSHVHTTNGVLMWQDGGFWVGTGTYTTIGFYNANTTSVGGGQSHENKPPYRAVYMWYRSA
jgi:hypothetical protein